LYDIERISNDRFYFQANILRKPLANIIGLENMEMNSNKININEMMIWGVKELNFVSKEITNKASGKDNYHYR
jgi:hypothetical protein